jgi:hypothetical protein
LKLAHVYEGRTLCPKSSGLHPDKFEPPLAPIAMSPFMGSLPGQHTGVQHFPAENREANICERIQ